MGGRLSFLGAPAPPFHHIRMGKARPLLVMDADWPSSGGGGGGAPSGAAGGVLSGTYPNPGAAASLATQAELDAAVATLQPLDSDLTAIAALSTTTFGRSRLTEVDAAAARTAIGLVPGTDVQAFDSDLAAIAALSTTSIGRSLLAAADAAALRTILAIPSTPVGTLVDYVEFTADTTVSATTEAAAQAIVTGAGFTPNGTDSFWIEFFCPAVLTGAGSGAQLRFSLNDNGSAIAAGASLLGQFLTPAAASSLGSSALLKRKVTPSNAAHAYSIRAWRLVANGVVDGTNAGIGLPGYIAITKAA